MDYGIQVWEEEALGSEKEVSPGWCTFSSFRVLFLLGLIGETMRRLLALPERGRMKDWIDTGSTLGKSPLKGRWCAEWSPLPAIQSCWKMMRRVYPGWSTTVRIVLPLGLLRGYPPPLIFPSREVIPVPRGYSRGYSWGGFKPVFTCKTVISEVVLCSELLFPVIPGYEKPRPRAAWMWD